jgi:hypothetical protein
MTGLAVPQSARLRCNTSRRPSLPPCINKGSQDRALRTRAGFSYLRNEKKAPGVCLGLQFGRMKHPGGNLRQPDDIEKRESRNKKWLRRAAIAFSYRRYVAAYPPGRVHRAVPPNQNG